MLKRLIEVALPLKEVSEQSAREKSIRHGHISTLHIWWARRPLAACRAAVFASLIPDPDDPECPENFRSLVKELLSENQYKPKNGDGSAVEDTLRNRCLEYIKHLVRWENSNSPHYIGPARKLIAAAHKILHPGAEGDAPRTLDPFTGGGAFPLEALRLGCEAHALDLNPVAHLIELCTLVYPQKYGQPNSRSVPDYIKRLIAQSRATRQAKGQESASLFSEHEAASAADQIIPDVDITEAEYRQNPLAADVKYWGHWVLEKAREEIGHFYPLGTDSSLRLAYLWANTLPCPNPSCRVTVPLLKQRWLVRSTSRSVAVNLVPVDGGVRFQVVEGEAISGDPSEATIKSGAMRCPVCLEGVYDQDEIKVACCKGVGIQPICVVAVRDEGSKRYIPFSDQDLEALKQAERACEALRNASVDGISVVPDELVGTDYEWALTVSLFGLKKTDRPGLWGRPTQRR